MICDRSYRGVVVWWLGSKYELSRWINIHQKGAREEYQVGVLVVFVSCFENVMIACMKAASNVLKSVLLRSLRN